MLEAVRRRGWPLEAGALLVLVAVYALTVLPGIGSDPIAGGDEGWIISASARLAGEGVFGSDLFAGFYGAEDHYYFNLPLHHLVLAGAFELLGEGLAQARLVSFVVGLAALLLTFALGRRVGGPSVGLGATALLVLLRLNLAPFSGLTLTDLGATVRYDLVCVPFGLGAMLLLLRRAKAPAAIDAAGAGLLIGLAALTQFIGAFFALPALVFLLSLSLPWARRLLLATLLAAAVALPFLPYAAYIAADWRDFRGQARSVEQRTDVLSPSFYVDQLAAEPDRFALGAGLQDAPAGLRDIVRRPSARVALLLAPIAAALTLWRGRDDPARRLVGIVLVTVVLQLALLESTKRFVYAVVAVPFLCVALADLAAWALARASLPRLRLPARRAAVALVLAVFAVEGVAVAAKDVRDAGSAPDYGAMGQALQAALPAGSVVLGDNRLWPALDRVELRSLLLLFYHTNPGISRERTTDIPGAFERVAPDYIVLSPLSREILANLSARDAADFQTFLEARTERIGSVGAPPYGPMEVYRVRP